MKWPKKWSFTYWMRHLDGGLVGMDAASLVYFLEEHPTYLAPLDGFSQALRERRLRAVTSTISLVETLTRPLREGDQSLAERREALPLNTLGLAVINVTVPIAERRQRSEPDIIFALRTRRILRLPWCAAPATY